MCIISKPTKMITAVEILEKRRHEFKDDPFEEMYVKDKEAILNCINDALNIQENGLRTLVPHRCPVCGGNGIVPNGFYRQTSGDWLTTDATPETCRICSGTGIVWG